MFSRGRGGVDDAVGNPRRARIARFEFFRACPPVEIRQAVPGQAIRGNGISVSSTLPPLAFLSTAATPARLAAGPGNPQCGPAAYRH